MGNKYHINLHPKEPSREEIQQHQDFDALLASFQSDRQKAAGKRRLRSISWYAGSMAAALAALLTFFFLRPANNISYQEKATAYFAAQEFVQPPLPVAAPDFASFQVDAGQGGVYEYSSGSRLVVPRSAFMSDRGELVQGKVNIHYRELQDYVDFFLAGIPMVYDSAGLTYYLESAGMIEIYAEQDGNRVQMAPDKAIDVELVSAISIPDIHTPPRYNVYKLNTAARNWVYQDIDRIQVLDDETPDPADPLYIHKKELSETMTAIDREVQAGLEAFEQENPRPRVPLRPRPSESGQPTLELDLDEDQVVFAGGARESISQLRESFGNVIWQISPASPSYDERAFRVKWEQVRINKINDWEYEINLIHGDNAVRLLVNPVLSDSAYAEAMKAFAAKETAYLAKQAEWEAARASVEKEVRAASQTRREEARRIYSEQIAALNLSPAQTQAALSRRKVINRFQAHSFGIWNCDRPVAPPAPTLQARFVDPQGQPYENTTAYLVNHQKNTLHRFLATDPTPLPIETASDYLLWIVTPDNRIALLRPDAFKGVNVSKDVQTFTLQPVNEPLTSATDVREQLQF